ncbi:hypothetical protein NE865_14004 [Phthorimaea operculella]|nr:hypothetical protein NE865_14004 [Phthorimaea operculella]
MEGRKCTSVRQLELLVQFAEEHAELALGKLRSKEARALANRLWADCANLLNSEGPARLPKEWAKIWNDMKSRVRNKLTSLTLSRRATGGGPGLNVTLSPLEERVANIIGRDVGPLPDVAQNPFLEAEPEDRVLVDVEESTQPDNSNEGIRLHLPGPSAQSLPWHTPPRRSPQTPHRQSPQTPPPRSRQSPLPPNSQPPPPRPTTLSQPPQYSQPPPLPASEQPSLATTPRRRRPRRRQRNPTTTASRVQTQAHTSRMALDESRAMVMRIEEMRARTDSLVAQAAFNQSEAAKAQAEAAVMQAQTMAKFCEALISLVPLAELALRRQARKRARRVSSSDEEP